MLIGIIAVTIYCIRLRKKGLKTKVQNDSEYDSDRGTVEDPKSTGRFQNENLDPTGKT